MSVPVYFFTKAAYVFSVAAAVAVLLVCATIHDKSRNNQRPEIIIIQHKNLPPKHQPNGTPVGLPLSSYAVPEIVCIFPRSEYSVTETFFLFRID